MSNDALVRLLEIGLTGKYCCSQYTGIASKLGEFNGHSLADLA
jgi:hypothetical protein